MAGGRGKSPDDQGLYLRGGIYWARVTLAGTEHRRSLSTRDRATARLRAQAWRTKLIDEKRFGLVTYRWQDAVIEWQRHIGAAVKPGTLKRYALSLRLVVPYLVDKTLAEIDRKAIAHLVAERRARGITTASIKRDLTAVSSVFDAAIAAGMAETNPARDFITTSKRTLRERRDPIVLPEPADIAFLLARLSPMVAAIVRLARATGMRLTEILTLERRQVDYTRGVLTLTKTKTSRPRVVRLEDEAVAALRSVPVMLTCPYVFWHDGGEPYVNLSSGFAHMVRTAQKTAQSEGRPLRPFRFHDLRHLAAVEMLRKGWSIYDVQHQLGHSSVKVTEGYLRYLSAEEADASKRSAAHFAAQGQRFTRDPIIKT